MGKSYSSSLFWKPFAQGVATPIVLIGGTNLLLKDFKVSNPYLYWGGLAASSAIVLGILADKIKVPILNAEGDSWDGTTGDDFRKYDDMELTEDDHEILVEEIERGFKNFPADTLRNAKSSAVSQINWFGIDNKHREYEAETFEADPEYEGLNHHGDLPFKEMDKIYKDARKERKYNMNHPKDGSKVPLSRRKDWELIESDTVDDGGDLLIVSALYEDKSSRNKFYGLTFYFDLTNHTSPYKINPNDENSYGWDYYKNFNLDPVNPRGYASLIIADGEEEGRIISSHPFKEMNAETTMTVEHKDGSKYRYSETDPIYGEMGGIVGHVSEIKDEKDTPYQKIYGRDVTRGHNFHLNHAETFNSDSHTDSFMADMPVNAVKHNSGWYIPSVHRNDYKEIFKNWKPSKYPYEKRITQDSVDEACNSCGKENVHYQFYLPRTNSVNPKMRFIDNATYCQYDTNSCGGNICGDCAENASCENCGADICTFCEEENNYDHSDLVCVDCREFNESLEDD